MLSSLVIHMWLIRYLTQKLVRLKAKLSLVNTLACFCIFEPTNTWENFLYAFLKATSRGGLSLGIVLVNHFIHTFCNLLKLI